MTDLPLTEITDNIKPIRFPYQSRSDAFAKTRAKLHAEPFRESEATLRSVGRVIAVANAIPSLWAVVELSHRHYVLGFSIVFGLVAPVLMVALALDRLADAARRVARDIETSL